MDGGILEVFGRMFNRDLKMYVYPWRSQETGEVQTISDVEIHPRIKPLYDYLVFNKRLCDIEGYDPEILDIFSRDVLEMIKSGYPGWERMVPSYVDSIIKDYRLFGYDPETAPNPNYQPSERVQKFLQLEKEAGR